MSKSSVEFPIDRWVRETARSFSESGLKDPELDAAINGAAEAIRQVLEVAQAPGGFTSEIDDNTSQPG